MRTRKKHLLVRGERFEARRESALGRGGSSTSKT
jgi:hypothetical protein